MLEAFLVTIICVLIMLFMRMCDDGFGDFMGMVMVMAIFGFALVAVLFVVGVFLIPIMLALAVPIFIFWFVYWLFKTNTDLLKKQLKRDGIHCPAAGKKSEAVLSSSRPWLHYNKR